jgi:hypothetical protein
MSNTLLNELKAYVEGHEGYSATIGLDCLYIFSMATLNTITVTSYQQARGVLGYASC